MARTQLASLERGKVFFTQGEKDKLTIDVRKKVSAVV